jgi:hypothetical protein
MPPRDKHPQQNADQGANQRADEDAHICAYHISHRYSDIIAHAHAYQSPM